MDVCGITKANGEACKAPVQGQNQTCWAHAPENAAKRKRVASRGGRGKAAKRVAVLWDEARAVIHGVESERLTPQQGNTMLRGYTTLIGLAKLDIETSELDIAKRRLELDEDERTELIERLEQLEQKLDTRRGPRRA